MSRPTAELSSRLEVTSDPTALLEALDPEQRQVAQSQSGPLVVLAGAGTGKTRAITHRIAYGVLSGVPDAQRTLAVTFTARAAGEMRTRLRELGVGGVQARTFHAAALRQLRFFWEKAYGGRVPELVKGKASLVVEAARSVGVRTDQSVIRDLAGEIEWAKTSLVPCEKYADIAQAQGRDVADLDPIAISRVMAAYENAKAAARVMDFEDVMMFTASMLRDNAGIAQTVRDQYRRFVVDEFQDVSPVQFLLLRLWLGESQEVCVVGDAAQTIYTFAGATPTYLTQFEKHFPRAERISLVRNYRSSADVVELANGVLQAAPVSHRRSYVSLQATKAGEGLPQLHGLKDPLEEADYIAARAKRLIDAGVRPSQIAVLYRTNGQSEPIETALEQAGVPYVVRGGERFFVRPEVRRAISALRAAAQGGGDDVVGTVTAVLTSQGWSKTPPAAQGAVRAEWESLQALVSLAEAAVASTPHWTIIDFVRDLETRADEQHAPEVEGVVLASLHSTKGLEWDHVVLAGASDGLIPISFAANEADVEEERRLLYVGITRARTSLTITYPLGRAGSSHTSREVSRFLSSVGKRVKNSRSRSAAPSYRSGSGKKCRVCGAPLTTRGEKTAGRCSLCPGTYDEGLFDALKAWRLETAKEASVPAFVVFTDATLTVIAEREPSTMAELESVPGVGRTKLAKYGQGVLDVVQAHSS